MKKIISLVLCLLLIATSSVSAFSSDKIYKLQENYSKALESFTTENVKFDLSKVKTIQGKSVYSDFLDGDTYIIVNENGYTASKVDGNKIILNSYRDGTLNTIEIDAEKINARIDQVLSERDEQNYLENTIGNTIITPNAGEYEVEHNSHMGYYRYYEFWSPYNRTYTLTIPQNQTAKGYAQSSAPKQNWEYTAYDFCTSLEEAANMGYRVEDRLSDIILDEFYDLSSQVISQTVVTGLMAVEISASGDVDDFISLTMSMLVTRFGSTFVQTNYRRLDSAFTVFSETYDYLQYDTCLRSCNGLFMVFKSQL